MPGYPAYRPENRLLMPGKSYGNIDPLSQGETAMRRFTSLLLLLVLLASFASAQKKKRVAILDFDYGTVRTDVAAIFGRDQNVGNGIAHMPVDRRGNEGTYSHMRRNAL